MKDVNSASANKSGLDTPSYKQLFWSIFVGFALALHYLAFVGALLILLPAVNSEGRGTLPIGQTKIFVGWGLFVLSQIMIVATRRQSWVRFAGETGVYLLFQQMVVFWASHLARNIG